ncbi:MAG: DNA translocase FtsK [Acholeplasmatales bacterium]
MIPKLIMSLKETMVNTETRKEVFGADVYVNTGRKYVDPRKKEGSIDVPFAGKKEVTFDQVIKPREEYLKEEIIYKKEEIKEEVPKTPFFEAKVEEHERVKPKVVEEISRLEEIRPHTPEVETFSPEPLEVEDTKVTLTPKEVEPVREVVKQKPRRKYIPPTHEMFSKVERDQNARPEWLVRLENTVNETLSQFGVDGKVHNIIKGPTVTRYEIALEPGVNVKKVEGIKDNLMMNLAAESLRIEAPIPGKPYVGLELPNEVPEIVAFGNVVEDPEFINSKAPLKIALGVDIDGNNIFYDIKKMPHGLIAGATNSGKSVCVNTIIMSLLMKNHPDDLKFIMIDPKMVELSIYDGIPHLVTPVITEPKMAATALAWATEEMDNRFLRFANARVKDLEGYNEKALTDSSLEKMPYIIIVIDELADLMMVSAKDVEDSIQRITQKARAAGIHLLVATQRPTTDVVKGTIKANIPTRIAFKVSQIKIQSLFWINKVRNNFLVEEI